LIQDRQPVNLGTTSDPTLYPNLSIAEATGIVDILSNGLKLDIQTVTTTLMVEHTSTWPSPKTHSRTHSHDKETQCIK
jgi:hypothetical protein